MGTALIPRKAIEGHFGPFADEHLDKMRRRSPDSEEDGIPVGVAVDYFADIFHLERQPPLEGLWPSIGRLNAALGPDFGAQFLKRLEEAYGPELSEPAYAKGATAKPAEKAAYKPLGPKAFYSCDELLASGTISAEDLSLFRRSGWNFDGKIDRHSLIMACVIREDSRTLESIGFNERKQEGVNVASLDRTLEMANEAFLREDERSLLAAIAHVSLPLADVVEIFYRQGRVFMDLPVHSLAWLSGRLIQEGLKDRNRNYVGQVQEALGRYIRVWYHNSKVWEEEVVGKGREPAIMPTTPLTDFKYALSEDLAAPRLATF